MTHERQNVRVHKLRLANRMEELGRMNAELEEIGRLSGWSDRTVLDVCLACEELIANIVSYGFPEGGEHWIEWTCSVLPDAAEFSFSDDGVPYDPLTGEEPDPTLGLDERTIGGWGIYFVKRVMDEVRYEREGDRNILRMRKTMHPGQAGDHHVQEEPST